MPSDALVSMTNISTNLLSVNHHYARQLNDREIAKHAAIL
jgi:hypothetical protein